MAATLKQYRAELNHSRLPEESLMYAALDLVDAPALREAADALLRAKDHFSRELARHDVEPN